MNNLILPVLEEKLRALEKDFDFFMEQERTKKKESDKFMMDAKICVSYEAEIRLIVSLIALLEDKITKEEFLLD